MNVVSSSRKNNASSSLNPILGSRSRIMDDKSRMMMMMDSSSNIELNFYLNPPSHELSLDEFEELALARLKVSFVLLKR